MTVIPASVFQKLNGIRLQPPQKILKGPSQKALPVKGQFIGNLASTERPEFKTGSVCHEQATPTTATETSPWHTCPYQGG